MAESLHAVDFFLVDKYLQICRVRLIEFHADFAQIAEKIDDLKTAVLDERGRKGRNGN